MGGWTDKWMREISGWGDGMDEIGRRVMRWDCIY